MTNGTPDSIANKAADGAASNAPLETQGAIAHLFSAAQKALTDPASDPGQTALVVGVLTAVVLLLVLLGLLTYFMISKRYGHKRRIELPARQLTPRERLISSAVLFTILAGLYLAVDGYTSRPSTCAMCHTDEKQAKALRTSPHKGVNCMACHQRPGVMGDLAQKVDYTRWVLYFPTIQQSPGSAVGKKDKPTFQATIADQSCLRCHGEIQDRVVRQRQIRVRHSDIIAAGYHCVDCHNTVAHMEEVANPKKPSMDKCVTCHDGKRASGECETCHVASDDLRELPKDFTRAQFGQPGNCRGCHDVAAECTVCHGVEMPHPTEYKKKYHAVDGFSKKNICFRCHDQKRFCNRCHRFPGPHGSNWVRQHGSASQSSSFRVYWAEVGELMKGCGACHRKNMCDACHDDGRRAADPAEALRSGSQEQE